MNPTNGDLTLVGTGSVDLNRIGSTTTGLYGIDTSGDLVSINPSNGATTLIGPLGIGIFADGDLSANSGALYFTQGPNLYTLSTTTGHATLVGSNNGIDIFSMVSENGSLYPEVGAPFSVDTLNITTGIGTFVADLSGEPSPSFLGMAPVPTSAVPEPG